MMRELILAGARFTAEERVKLGPETEYLQPGDIVGKEPWARSHPVVSATWMHEAARTNDLGLIRLLIARGVSAQTGTSSHYPAPKGPTPLEVARTNKQQQAVELLEANGAL
jgi:hypothetical protein